MREFANIGALVAHLATVERSMHKRLDQALEKSAQVIEKAAKDKIGEYQEAEGHFAAWEQLADSTLAHHEAMGVGDTPLLVTGGLYGSIEHEVRDGQAVIGSKLEIANYQEFGTDTIPPRPFLGPAALQSKAKVEKIMGQGLLLSFGANIPGLDEIEG
ncbi:MAG: hypothetical protein JO002_15935 [Burkholderiaceae bacterium]|nr:hypothetical protein [Burkholderiaceae bacterium]